VPKQFELGETDDKLEVRLSGSGIFLTLKKSGKTREDSYRFEACPTSLAVALAAAIDKQEDGVRRDFYTPGLVGAAFYQAATDRVFLEIRISDNGLKWTIQDLVTQMNWLVAELLTLAGAPDLTQIERLVR